jgi:hypothetical protein
MAPRGIHELRARVRSRLGRRVTAPALVSMNGHDRDTVARPRLRARRSRGRTRNYERHNGSREVGLHRFRPSTVRAQTGP